MLSADKTVKKGQGREILQVCEAAASLQVNIWEALARWTHKRLLRDTKLPCVCQGFSKLLNVIPHKISKHLHQWWGVQFARSLPDFHTGLFSREEVKLNVTSHFAGSIDYLGKKNEAINSLVCLNKLALCLMLSKRKKKVTVSFSRNSQASSNPGHPICWLRTHILLKIYCDLFSVSVTASSLLENPTVPNVTLINHQPWKSILQWIESNETISAAQFHPQSQNLCCPSP